jgi:hypothetical protein
MNVGLAKPIPPYLVYSTVVIDLAQSLLQHGLAGGGGFDLC